MKKIMLVIAIVYLILPLQVQASVFANSSHCLAFQICTDGNGRTAKPVSQWIVLAGENYLKASGYFSLYLAEIEGSELREEDLRQASKLLTVSIKHMKLAKDFYVQIVDAEKYMQYDLETQEALKAFDYDAFCSENAISDSTKEELRKYLAVGDVRGIHLKLLNDMVRIDALLERELSSFDTETSSVSTARETSAEIGNTQELGTALGGAFNQLKGVRGGES